MKRFALCFMLVTAVASHGSGQTAAETTVMNELASQYQRAASEKERMLLCIRAIDQGLVSRGGSIRAFDSLFGTHLSKDIPARGKSVGKGALFFAEQPPSPSDEIAAVMRGWYLVVEFDSSGVIQNYFLSNLHK
jgi:hypothetical protein